MLTCLDAAVDSRCRLRTYQFIVRFRRGAYRSITRSKRQFQGADAVRMLTVTPASYFDTSAHY